MITVHQEAWIQSRYNIPPYPISCVNSYYWQCTFSLGKVVLDPPTIRRVTWVFLKFVFGWWMMSWSPHIFASFSKKASVVDHCFIKKHRNQVFPLWFGMWMRRSLWTMQRRQNVWWVGASRLAWWICTEKYFWKFIHWRGNGIGKLYL